MYSDQTHLPVQRAEDSVLGIVDILGNVHDHSASHRDDYFDPRGGNNGGTERSYEHAGYQPPPTPNMDYNHRDFYYQNAQPYYDHNHFTGQPYYNHDTDAYPDYEFEDDYDRYNTSEGFSDECSNDSDGYWD